MSRIALVYILRNEAYNFEINVGSYCGTKNTKMQLRIIVAIFVTSHNILMKIIYTMKPFHRSIGNLLDLSINFVELSSTVH